MFCHGSNLGFTSSKSPIHYEIPHNSGFLLWYQCGCQLTQYKARRAESLKKMIHEKSLAEVEIIFFRSRFDEIWKKNYLFILFFNTLISLHLRAICKTCSNLQGRRNDETCKLRKIGQRISSNHKGLPNRGCEDITRYCEGSNGEFGIRYLDHHLTVCCCRLWVPAGEHDKIPSSIVHTYYLLKISALATWQRLRVSE
jgi:hypothetical protein